MVLKKEPQLLRQSLLALASLSVLAACGSETPPADMETTAPQAEATSQPREITGTVNVYSARHYDSDAAIYRQFTEETGIKVNLLEAGSDQLIQRLQSEAEFSPADVLITVDAGRLWRAVEGDVFQPLSDETLAERVPEAFRDPEGLWWGITKRARVIVYNKEKGLPEGLETYEDLADPAYRGQICMRSSTNIYNISLLASIIERDGAAAAQEWADGVVANFARPPQGNDTSILRSIAEGECGIGLANTYYIARFGASDDMATKDIYDSIGILFPNQETSGTHVNVSGIGLTKYAKNKENAIALMEFLTRPDIQTAFSSGNNEYPINPDTETAPQVEELGTFREDDLHVAALGENQTQAVMVFDRAGWN